MNLKLLATLLMFNAAHASDGASHRGNTQKITLTLTVPSTIKSKSLSLLYMPPGFISNRAPHQSAEALVTGGTVKWELPSSGPLLIRLPLRHAGHAFYYFEPGDSMFASKNENRMEFSGNAHAKFELLQAIYDIPASLPAPENKKYYKTSSLEDYLEWNTYLNRQKKLTLQLLNEYMGKITPAAFDFIKKDAIENIEKERIMKFYGLQGAFMKNNISQQKLIPIYDSTILNAETSWMNSLDDNTGNNGYYYLFGRLHLRRVHGFEEVTQGTGIAEKDVLERNKAYLAHGKKIFRGEVLYNYQTQIVTEDLIRKLIFKNGIKSILRDFYASDVPERYKQYTREFEERIRKREIGKREEAPDFAYKLENGKEFTNAKGKIQVLTFLEEGDPASIAMAAEISRLQRSLGGKQQLVFSNVLLSGAQAAQNKAAADTIFKDINAMRMRTGSSILEDFSVGRVPAYFIIDPDGKFAHTSLEIGKPLSDAGVADNVKQEIALLSDGPYINRSAKGLAFAVIREEKVLKQAYPAGKLPEIEVMTDRHDKTFQVRIRENAVPPAVTYPDAKKIYAVSDIEGNFTMFRQLLQANGVIDSNYNWTFGDGHLVLLGDFFDRGKQVTECLWLIYMLEEKAEKSGGRVHFILGNHELMNFSGDLRYVHQKYLTAVKTLNLPYQQMYDQTSVLGQWLRSRNIVENIGGVLFVHGGISKEVKNTRKPLDEINRFARRYLDVSPQSPEAKDTLVDLLLLSQNSPCWYRGYYDERKKAPQELIDETLTFFDASCIVTGHTVLGNNISVHHGGKVINIDTRHKYGFSEGLLIDGGQYYRTDTRGMQGRLPVPAEHKAGIE